MTILSLRITSQSHAASKEGEMPDVSPSNTGTGVDAEDSDTGEGSDGSDPEAEHVRDGGDGDGDGGFSISFSYPFGNCVMDGGSSPSSQHYKSVIYSNA